MCDGPKCEGEEMAPSPLANHCGVDGEVIDSGDESYDSSNNPPYYDWSTIFPELQVWFCIVNGGREGYAWTLM